MQHWLAIAGSVLGVAGTVALSFDLLRSKSSEESVAEFKNLQDQADAASQALAIRMNEGLATLARFISGYLSLLEIQAQIAEEDSSGTRPTGSDPELEKIRQFISGKSEASLRRYSVEKFVEAQKSLASPEIVRKGLNLVAETRERVEQRYKQEVALSQQLKRWATIGVVLVGIGAISQLLDLLLYP